MQAPALPKLTTIDVKLESHVALITLNRPDKSNAMNDAMWEELRSAFEWVDRTPQARVVVLGGNGENFCGGIDLAMAMSLQGKIKDDCVGRQNEKVHELVLHLQSCLNSLERCRKPIIAAVQGACMGAGLDLIAAADLRYCCENAYFCVKEIDLGIVADMGSLQRLPHLIGDGRTREMAFTGRNVSGDEAERMGLVSRCYPDMDTLLMGVMEIADGIASKSPLTMRGIKQVINYSRDHSVADGLQYVAAWNAGMLISKDLETAAICTLMKEQPVFRD